MATTFARKWIGARSLERKFLIFLGSALLLSILVSTSAIQAVASRLVMELTRQRARDFSKFVVVQYHETILVPSLADAPEPLPQAINPQGIDFSGSKQPSQPKENSDPTAEQSATPVQPDSDSTSDFHTGQESDSVPTVNEKSSDNRIDLQNSLSPDELSALQSRATNEAVLRWLRKDLFPAGFTSELFRLDDNQEYDDLQGSVPRSEADLKALYKIEAALRNASAATTSAASDNNLETGRDALIATNNQKNDNSTSVRLPSDSRPISSPKSGSEVVAEKSPQSIEYFLTGPNASSTIFHEIGPVGESYYYYHPIEFARSCMDCHALKSGTLASADAELPFRVLRIKMPYAETWLWTIWSYSIVTAIAIATLAMSLFFIHWILKGLVLRPLGYLRDLADEVSRGNLNIRSEIDTDDEFFQLSDSFNRMLRNLTEAQIELKDVNRVLDTKVDQLAQVNLQLYEANRLKSDFLANMSHELRTPLNSILGFSDVLQGFDTLTDKQKRYAANIQKSGRLLLEMINDILDLAKVEAGKMEVRASRFDVVHLIEGQCDVMRKLCDDKNIDLHIEISPDLYRSIDEAPSGEQGRHFENEPAIETQRSSHELILVQDQAKLQQILTNLLSNAIKFTPQGGMITAKIHPIATSVDSVGNERSNFSFTIADTGVGIAPQDHDAIFEKFRQASASRDGDTLTREYSGTGLGLSIVRELCRLLGGEISLESQLGKGSNFTVRLPTFYQPPETPNAAAGTSSIAHSFGEGETFIAAPH